MVAVCYCYRIKLYRINIKYNKIFFIDIYIHFSCNVNKWLSLNTISLNIFDRVPVLSGSKRPLMPLHFLWTQRSQPSQRIALVLPTPVRHHRRTFQISTAHPDLYQTPLSLFSSCSYVGPFSPSLSSMSLPLPAVPPWTQH